MLKDVAPLQLLPGEKRPVVQYVNSSEDATRAGFVVSPDVTAAKGDGKCDPGRNNCQYLFMRGWRLQTLVWGQSRRPTGSSCSRSIADRSVKHAAGYPPGLGHRGRIGGGAGRRGARPTVARLAFTGDVPLRFRNRR